MSCGGGAGPFWWLDRATHSLVTRIQKDEGFSVREKKGNSDLFPFEIEHNLNQYTLRWFLLRQVNREKKPPRFSLGCWPRGKKSGLVTRTQWASWGERVSEAVLAADTYLPDMGCMLAVGPWGPGMVQVWSFLGRHILGKWDFPALKNHCLEAHRGTNDFFWIREDEYLIVVLMVLTARPGS